jgi:hypothetical protein
MERWGDTASNRINRIHIPLQQAICANCCKAIELIAPMMSAIAM